MAKPKKPLPKAKTPLFRWSISEKDVPKTGPYLSAALFAEDVEREEATKVISIKRIVDIVSLSPEVLKGVIKGGELILPMKMLVTFKTGGFQGDAVVMVCQTNPSGEFEAISRADVKRGDWSADHLQIISPVMLKWDKEGEYYFDLFLDGKFCSRMSLNVKVGDQCEETINA
jgi:hypothetical protein